ncbi:MAG: ribosome small subunit-dependent GTPase A [Gimesia sp.]
MDPLSETLQDLGWREKFAVQLSEEELHQIFVCRVTAEHRTHLDIELSTGPDRLKKPSWVQQTPITVGDWLTVDRETLQIKKLLDRNSVLKRKAPGTSRDIQLIAANVDTLFVVTSCNQDFNIARIERYLILAEEAQVTPIIVVTKIDECDNPVEYRQLAESIKPGLTVELVNALDDNTLEPLSIWCGRGKTVGLVGSSGVGKSTITNTLLEQSAQKTAGIRQDDDKGRHTTSVRSMHRLKAGGWLIDTPGMREIQIFDVDQGVESIYEDIVMLAAACRFSDCSHESEPGCQVQMAIADGRLTQDRLNRYHKIEREQKRNSENLAQRRSREKDFQSQVNKAQRNKRNRNHDSY